MRSVIHLEIDLLELKRIDMIVVVFVYKKQQPNYYKFTHKFDKVSPGATIKALQSLWREAEQGQKKSSASIFLFRAFPRFAGFCRGSQQLH